MILTENDIRKLEEDLHCLITPRQKAIILERFGNEPDESHVWTEQDIIVIFLTDSSQLPKILHLYCRIFCTLIAEISVF